MAGKRRPPVGNRRARAFKAAPRPGQKQSRLKAYRLALSEAAERLIPADHAKRLAESIAESLQGAQLKMIATGGFHYDGREFAWQAHKDLIYICLPHETLKDG